MSDFVYNDSLWTSLDPDRSNASSGIDGGFEGLISTGIDTGKVDQYGLPTIGIAPSNLLATNLPAPSTSSGSSPEAEHVGRSSDEYHPAEKRKGSDARPHAHKDARRGSGGGHAHDLEDDEDDDGASAAGETRGAGRRKSSGAAGKAPITERRRAQNRAAQTAFRERKTAHLKSLEDTITALQTDNSERTTENKNLRELVEQLRQENERLRSATEPADKAAPTLSMPTFTMPASQSAPPPPSLPGFSFTLPTMPVTASSRSSSGNSNMPFSPASFASGRSSGKERSPSLPFDADHFSGSDDVLRKIIASPEDRAQTALPPVSKSSSFELPAATEPGVFTPGGEHLNEAFFSLTSAMSPPAPIAGASPAAAASPAAWTSYRDAPTSVAQVKPAAPWSLDDDLESFLNAGSTAPNFGFESTTSPAFAANSASQSPQSTTLATPAESCAVIELSRQFGVTEPDLNVLCAEFKTKATCTEAARVALQRALSEGQSGGIDDARRVMADGGAYYSGGSHGAGARK